MLVGPGGITDEMPRLRGQRFERQPDAGTQSPGDGPDSAAACSAGKANWLTIVIAVESDSGMSTILIRPRKARHCRSFPSSSPNPRESPVGTPPGNGVPLRSKVATAVGDASP